MIGAQLDDHDDVGADVGSAYVYRFDGEAWIEEAMLTASDASAGDQFGVGVSISGNVIMIGAAGDDGGGGSHSGSAYVYRFNGMRWIEEAKLTPSNPTFNAHFGEVVSVRGDVVLIGAHIHKNTGGAYVYRFDPDTSQWLEEAELTASDGAAVDKFGDAVSLDRHLAVIGARRDDDGGDDSGSAYVFRFDWIEEAKLTASDAQSGDSFGDAVSLDRHLAVIGAPGDDDGGDNSGSAYVFRFDGIDWIEEAKLTASDAATGADFGHSVAVSGDVILIGARRDDARSKPDPLLDSGVRPIRPAAVRADKAGAVPEVRLPNGRVVRV